MRARHQKTGKLSIVNHCIVPLISFGLGVMVASSFAQSPAHADERIITFMARVNELEEMVSSAENSLRLEKSQSNERLQHMKGLLEEEKIKVRDAELMKAMPGAGGASAQPVKCPPCEPAASSVALDMSQEIAEEEAWAAQVAEQGGTDMIKGWKKISSKWQATEIDPLRFLSVFDVGLPTETLKWSGGHLMLPSSLRLNDEEKSQTPVQHVQQHCTELDVMVLNDRHCVAVTHVNGAAAGHNTPYHISRFLKGGYKAGGRQKGDAAGSSHGRKNSWELVSRLTTPKGGNEGAPPGSYSSKTHRKALQKFLASVDDVENKLRPVLAKAATKDKVVITMTMNAGMTDLVSNFYCSARRAGGAHLHEAGSGISIDHLVVFPTDDEAAAVAKGLGVLSFQHPSFGDFPKEEAKTYGDNTFVAMMWIKVLCVYLPISLGYNVLFQDADVVWLKDPVHDYFLHPQIAGDFDVWFQDDGSRSTRFSPYFSNSGFYYLKNNLRTKQFMATLLYAGDTILEWRSHQSALVQALADASSKYGLKVKTLSYSDFPSGKDYHHRAPYMKAWMSGKPIASVGKGKSTDVVDPYAFHMCWTQNKVDKLKYLQQMGGWFLKSHCDETSIRNGQAALQSPGGDLASSCCSEEPVVTCHFRDKPSKHSCANSPPKDKGRPSFW